MKVRVLYFAALRDARGVDAEQVSTQATDLRALFGQLREAHALGWTAERLRPARNGAFARWEDPITEGDEIAFLPPVSGG